MIVEKQVGTHKFIKEEADLCAFHFGGELSETEIAEMMDSLVEVQGEQPTYMLLNFTKMPGMSAGARRIVGERARLLDLKAIGMYGASFQMKVIAKLVNSAIALFRKNALPQEFFDDEASARAWLNQARAKNDAGGR